MNSRKLFLKGCPLPSNAALERVLLLPSPAQVAIRSCFARKVPDSWLTNCCILY
ncbi:hypothetical protein GBA52_015358 [Prunus armeniaca]|nr:hypothetical protein GBA52_015358 [Prunus armeniaca]